MAEIKIGASGAKTAIDSVNKSLTDTGKIIDAANKKPLHILAPKTIEDLKEAIRLTKDLIGLQRQAGGGTGAGPVIGGGGTGAGMPSNHNPPHASQVGPGGHGGARSGGRWSNYGERGLIGRAGGAFIGGVGGATSAIGAEAMRGASSGGGMGLLKGGLIGAGLYGAYKAGSSLSEGYDRAKNRAIDLDSLKRSMGDLNVSFMQLKAASDAAGQGMGINSNEAVKMAMELNRLSGGLSQNSIMNEVRTSAGFGRAYGVSSNAFGQFSAGQKFMGSDQSGKQLALQIGEVIAKTGLNARVPELLQAIAGFSQATNRTSLGAPGVEGWGGALSGLMHTGITGLSSDTAMGMLGTANNAMMHGGAKGEASMNFTMAAFNRYGKLNPIQAMMLSEGGLFGTRASMFGKGSAYEAYMGKGAGAALMGDNPNATNLSVVMEHMRRSGQTKELMANSIQGMFGLPSMNQAMAFAAMKPEEIGATGNLLKRLGIDPSTVKDTGINTLSRIASAKSSGGLADIANGMGLTDSEKKSLVGSGFKEMQEALAKLAAGKEQQETQGSLIVKGEKDIETAITALGDKLLGPAQVMRDAMLVMVGKTEGGVAGAMLKMQQQEVADKYQPELDNISKGMSSPWKRLFGGAGAQGSYDAKNKFDNLSRKRDAEMADIKYGLPAGTLWGMYGTESAYGSNPGTSSAGARGNFQFMAGTAKQYGVNIGDFSSELNGAGAYMRDIMKRHHGNLRESLGEYNGAKSPANIDKYYNSVMKNGGITGDGGAQVPGGISGSGNTGSTVVVVNGKFQLVDAGGNEVAAPVNTSSRISTPRSAGVH